MNDPINPDHYQAAPDTGVQGECIDYTEHLGFLAGNAFKYVWRAGRKGDTRQDLEKAAWYLGRLHETGIFHRDVPLIVDGGVPETPRRRILTLIAQARPSAVEDAEALIRYTLDNPAALDGPAREAA